MSKTPSTPHSRQPSANKSRPRTGGNRLRLLGLSAVGGLLLLVLLLAVSTPVDAACVAAPRTYYIDDDYPAVNPAACRYQSPAQVLALGPMSGDIYIIYNGNYSLNHNLTVSGTTWIGESESGVVINASGTNLAPLAVRASNTNLTNLTFNGNSWALEVDYNGGTGGNSNATTIQGVSLNANSYGCVCWGNNVTVRDATVRAQNGLHNSDGWDFTVQRLDFMATSGSGGGVYAYGQGSVDISDSQLGGALGFFGMDLEKPDVSVTNVSTSGTYYALYLWVSGNATIRGLDIQDTRYGVYYGNTGRHLFRDVTITNATQYGFYAWSASRATMQNVAIDGCGTCLYAASTASVSIRGFTGSNGSYGFNLQSSSVVNASGVTLVNFTTAPVYGASNAILNLSGALLAGGSDNIVWTSNRPLFVEDALMGLSSDSGIDHSTSTGLTLRNVTIIDQPNYAVYCHPCSSFTWVGGGADNVTTGFYPGANIPTTISHVDFTNIRDTAVAMWWGGSASYSFDNLTIANAGTGIYAYGPSGLQVSDCTFVNIRYGALYFGQTTQARIYGNSFINATMPLQWEPVWTPNDQRNFHDIPTSNTVDGRPIYYLLNVTGFTVPANSSLVIAINSSGLVVDSLNQTTALYGVILAFSRDVTITNSRLVGYSGSVLSLYSDNLTFNNITAFGHPSGWNAGMNLYYSNNITVTDLTAIYLGSSLSGNGVNWRYGQNATFERVFTLNTSSGVGVYQGSNLDVRDVAAFNLGFTAIDCAYCTNARISNVTSFNTSFGAYLYYANGVDIQDLFVLNTSSYGLYSYRGNQLNLTSVAVLSTSGFGLYVRETGNVTIVDSQFATNASIAGYVLSAPNFRSLGSTYVSLNASSFMVSGTVPNFLMYHNNFYGGAISNTAGLGTWDFGWPVAGNYYAWAVGGFTDEFGGAGKTTPGKDGIADQNYHVGGAAYDYYPLMDPWAPDVALTSPADGSVVVAGTPLNFSVSNFFDSVAWSDAFGGNGSTITYPHDIDTAGWADGWHNITVTATDGVAPTVVRTFSFDFDSTAPAVTATPTLGSATIAEGTQIDISITDAHLAVTQYEIDGGTPVIGAPPWSISTTGWAVGSHTIIIEANDTAGNSFYYSWTFYIDGAAPTLGLFEPTATLFVQPGTQFTYDALDEYLLGAVDFTATGLNATGPYSGALTVNGSRYSVDTTGWDDGCYDLAVTANDDAGHSTVVSQQVCVDGTAPDLSAIVEYSGDEDVPFVFPGADVSDLDWLPAYTWEFDPDVFLALQTLTGPSPTWTFDTPGTINVHLEVVDRAGNLAAKDFNLSIWDLTPPTPVFTLPGSAPEDVNITLDATDSSDNDPFWSVDDSALFEWEVTGPTGTLTFSGSVVSVNLTEPGNHTVVLTVFDPTGLSATLSRDIVTLDKTPPDIVVDDLETVINEEDSIYFDASGTTDNSPGTVLTFVWSFRYDGSPQTVHGDYLEFTFDIPGTYAITLMVTDSASNVGTLPISLRVNANPALGNSPLTEVEAGQAYSWQMEIVDPDAGDTHSFALDEGPGALTVTDSGLVQWSPSVNAYGVHRVHIDVYDEYGYLEVIYVITVTRADVPGNHAPAFGSFPVQSATPGSRYSYDVAFSDIDAGDRLTLALAEGPELMTLDSADALTWDVPSWAEDGDSFTVSLALSDGLFTVYQNFTIRIRLANAAAQFVAGAIATTIGLEAGKSTSIPLGPGVATDTDDPYADLAFFVIVDGNAVEASIQIIGGTPTLVVSGLNAGTSTVTLRVADPSGAGEELDLTATVTGATPAGDDLMGILLLVAVLAGAGIVGLILVKRRRPGEEGVAMETPVVDAEEVQVEVVQEPAPGAKPAVPPGAAVGAGAAAVGIGAAAAAGAARPAMPPAAVRSKRATYTIEGLFVIYQDGRMIFSKTDLGADQLGDPELVSSMFTAVQQFIKDSFSAEGELNKMGYGDNQIFIERGNHVYMAAIAFGEPDMEFHDKMSTAIEKIEYAYAGVIEAWDGQTNRFSDMEKYVAPVLGLTAGITRGDVRAATTTREIKMLSQLEFFQGFVRLKVGVKNDMEAVVTKVTLDIDYNEDVLRLQRIEPASYKTSGARVMLNVLNPGEKSSVAFYFDPQICTETNIDGIVRFRDYKGVLQSQTMKTRKAEVVCPLFFTKEHANTAMLKRLIETELAERDSKIYTITKIPPYVKHKDIFEVCKQVVLSHDVHMVREFVTYNPFSGEAWFYGETKVKGYKIVIRTAAREDNMIEFFAASSTIKAVTGLLAEFNHTLVAMVNERYSDVKIEQVYDEGTKHEVQAKALVDKLGEGEATAGETDQ